MVDLVVVESATAVTLGNVRRGKAILLALHLLAVADVGNPEAFGGDFFNQAGTAADRTNTHNSSKPSASNRKKVR
jgi:hypothetical protein